jgi:Tfp pilus assembly protein PilF
MNPKYNKNLALSLFLSVLLGSSIGEKSLAKEIDWDKTLASGYHELAIGNTEKAQSVFEGKSQKYPQSGACHTALGKTYKKLGKTSQAKMEFQKACQSEPSFAESFYELAVLEEGDRNWDNAASSFEKYMQLKPELANRQGMADRIKFCRSHSSQ